MKKLVLLLVLMAGKLLAQNPALKPLFTRTVTGNVKDTKGADVSECLVKLKLDDSDNMIAETDMSGHFTLENVKSARFSVTILSLNYHTLVYRYNGNDQEKQITLPVSTLEPIGTINTTFSKKNWKVGDKIDAGPDIFRPALVLAVNYEKTSFQVHYEDGSHPDGWIDGSRTRPYNLQFKSDSAAAAKGLRPGKYVMYIYQGDVGYYEGYFIIHADGTYEVFLDNSKPLRYHAPHLSGNGNGEYIFNKTLGTVKWLTGPFLSLDGTAHLSASIDGSAYVIQLLSSDGLSGTYYSKK